MVLAGNDTEFVPAKAPAAGSSAEWHEPQRQNGLILWQRLEEEC